MSRPRLSAVTIPAMGATMFVANFAPETLPASVAWSDWTIDEDVRLVVSNAFSTWPGVAADGEPAVLCRSTSDPHHYEIFERTADIGEAEFIPTGTTFGGLYSEAHWGRFVQDFHRILKFLRISDVDPPGALEEALPTAQRVY